MNPVDLIASPAQKTDAPALRPEQAERLAGARAVHQMATKGLFNAPRPAGAVRSTSGIQSALAGAPLDDLQPTHQEARKADPKPALHPKVAALPGLTRDARTLLSLIVVRSEAAGGAPVRFDLPAVARALQAPPEAAAAVVDELLGKALLAPHYSTLGGREGFRPLV